MKNILFISNSISFGGAAKILCFVANSLAERDYNISIVNLNNTNAKGNFKQKLSDKISLYELYSNGRRGFRRLEQINQVAKIAKHTKSNVVVGFTAMPNFIAKMVGLKLHIPSIMSERADPFISWSKSWGDKILLCFINNSTGGVFQTEGAMEFYSKRLQKRGTVIPNPIFIKGEIPDIEYKDREKTVVSVGRLDMYQKRYDVMLNAFKIFSEKHPDYTLKLYGDGSDVETIKGIICDLCLTEKVEFMGVTTNPIQDTAKEGMFLITSDFEGISNALLEAMASGLPCVSTDHSPGGARLLITHGENDLLAPIGDAEGLAKCMCEFAENPELAKKCGENAKDVVNRFNPEKIIDMWEKYIEQIS